MRDTDRQLYRDIKGARGAGNTEERVCVGGGQYKVDGDTGRDRCKPEIACHVKSTAGGTVVTCRQCTALSGTLALTVLLSYTLFPSSLLFVLQ